MRRLIEKFKMLDAVKRAEAVIALLLTLAVFAGTPALAWFSYMNEVELMTKIKEPENLDIRAGNYDEVINLDLRNIDIEAIEKDAGTGAVKYSAKYVFSVSAGDYKIPYRIQVAHTTNIPFVYHLYRATRGDSTEPNSGYFAIYHPIGEADNKTYYTYDETTDLLTIKLNEDEANLASYGRTLAKYNDQYYLKTYIDNGDNPQLYAIPLYQQTGKLNWERQEGEHDYYVLVLEWDSSIGGLNGFRKWNKAENNQETDIIYICAAKATT